jgi:2-methylcitrate dehydratase PrpD
MSDGNHERTADFIHNATWSNLPDSVQQAATRNLIDLLATLAAGTSTEASRLARDAVAATHRGGPAPIAFDGRSVSPVGAALANATTLDSMDAHDGHRLAKGHAGAGVLAAALALAPESNWRGSDLLASLVVGYEVALRAALELHATSATYHASGSWVALGAAAVAARALGLPQEATGHALGIAEYHGPRAPMMRCIDHPTMVKDATGWGSMTGVFAALLAEQGFTGAPAELIGTSSGPGSWDSLGRRWLILQTYYKLYPCCRWAQPALQAALTLKREGEFAVDQIVEIHVETFEAATHLNHPRPASTEQAQYSLPYPLAAALYAGGLDPKDVLPGALARTEVLGLAERVRLTLDEELDAAFPEQALARVAILLKDGRRLVSDAQAAPGDPGTPVTEDVLLDKYDRYTRPLLGADRAEALLEEVGRLPELPDLGAFLALVAEPLSPSAGSRSDD